MQRQSDDLAPVLVARGPPLRPQVSTNRIQLPQTGKPISVSFVFSCTFIYFHFFNFISAFVCIVYCLYDKMSYTLSYLDDVLFLHVYYWMDA